MTTNPNNSFMNVSNLAGQVPTVNVADLNLVNSKVDQVVANKVLLTDAQLTTTIVAMPAVEINEAGVDAKVEIVGNDTKGNLDVSDVAVTAGDTVTIKVTFNKAYENAPVVIVKMGKDNLDNQAWYVTSTTKDFIISFPSVGSETEWSMNYLVVGLE